MSSMAYHLMSEQHIFLGHSLTLCNDKGNGPDLNQMYVFELTGIGVIALY